APCIPAVQSTDYSRLFSCRADGSDRPPLWPPPSPAHTWRKPPPPHTCRKRPQKTAHTPAALRIPMILGFGCTVPAIMASRALEDKKDRLKTMLDALYVLQRKAAGV